MFLAYRETYATLYTNVIKPERLTPEQLMAAYRRRLSVERMYLAMKEVALLNPEWVMRPEGARFPT